MIPTAEQWRARGRLHSVLGHPLFVIDEGPRDAPVLALLHGFPSCSYDFWRVLPQLALEHRVIVHDHVGFGHSAKPRSYSYSILDQANHALALWRSLGVDELHVLAHDYGCSIAAELFVRRAAGDVPVRLRTATLVNSGLYYHMARLRLVQHLLRLRFSRPIVSRLGSWWMFKATMRKLWGEGSDVSDDDLDAELAVLWQLASRDNGKPALGWLSHYLEERRYIHAERWNQGIRDFDAPAQVLWGDRDPVGTPAIARKLADELPRSTLTWLPGVGHYPMLEAPDRFAQAVLAWLAEHRD